MSKRLSQPTPDTDIKIGNANTEFSDLKIQIHQKEAETKTAQKVRVLFTPIQIDNHFENVSMRLDKKSNPDLTIL